LVVTTFYNTFGFCVMSLTLDTV